MLIIHFLAAPFLPPFLAPLAADGLLAAFLCPLADFFALLLGAAAFYGVAWADSAPPAAGAIAAADPAALLWLTALLAPALFPPADFFAILLVPAAFLDDLLAPDFLAAAYFAIINHK